MAFQLEESRASTSSATLAYSSIALGEPIHGRTADKIYMADLLGQLFAYTEVFDMATQPELINLQKSVVVVEGVARSLDPSLNLWTAAGPIAREWIEANQGAEAEDAMHIASVTDSAVQSLFPAVLAAQLSCKSSTAALVRLN